MSNILKTEAAQTKLSAAQTSTNEAQTNETIVGNVEHVGGWVTSETATKYYFNILKTEAAQTIFFYGTNRHKRSTNKQDHFAWIWSMWGAEWRHRLYFNV